MPQPSQFDRGQDVLRLTDPPARDERSMAWLEYLVSIVSVAAAILLALGR